jgi:dUTP pyrophosphatase
MERQFMVKLLSEKATPPKRAESGASGYDLYSAEDFMIPSWTRKLISTDIAVEIPEGHNGRVAPRSGLASKFGIDVSAGVIDQSYRGPLFVLLVNNSDNDFVGKKGDRIAQLILEKISTPEVRVVSELSDTSRGSGGFGSTGK